MKNRSLRARVSRLERSHARSGGQPIGRGARAWASLTDAEFLAFFETGELPAGIGLDELFGPAWLKLTAEQAEFIIDQDGVLPPSVDPDALFEDMPQLTDAQRLLLAHDDDQKNEPRGCLINAPPIPSG